MALSSLGEPALLTLCSVAQAGTGRKYICLNTSLKITSGQSTQDTKSPWFEKGKIHFQRSCYFRLRSYSQTLPGPEFCDWLLMTSSPGPAPSPPSPTMSSELKHLSDVMQGGTQVASLLPSSPLSFPIPLSIFIFSLRPFLSAHQLHPDKNPFPPVY